MKSVFFVSFIRKAFIPVGDLTKMLIFRSLTLDKSFWSPSSSCFFWEVRVLSQKLFVIGDSAGNFAPLSKRFSYTYYIYPILPIHRAGFKYNDTVDSVETEQT